MRWRMPTRAMSSTAIVLRQLGDQMELTRTHARLALGILLTAGWQIHAAAQGQGRIRISGIELA